MKSTFRIDLERASSTCSAQRAPPVGVWSIAETKPRDDEHTKQKTKTKNRKMEKQNGGRGLVHLKGFLRKLSGVRLYDGLVIGVFCFFNPLPLLWWCSPSGGRPSPEWFFPCALRLTTSVSTVERIQSANEERFPFATSEFQYISIRVLLVFAST